MPRHTFARYTFVFVVTVAGLCSAPQLFAQGFGGGGNAGMGGGGAGGSSSGTIGAFSATSASSFSTAGFGDGSFANAGFTGSSSSNSQPLVGTLGGNQYSMYGGTPNGPGGGRGGGGFGGGGGGGQYGANRTSTSGTAGRGTGQNGSTSSTGRRSRSTTPTSGGQGAQPYFEPRIEVGFIVPMPTTMSVAVSVSNTLHATALDNRFSGVQVAMDGNLAILRGTVSTLDDRQLAEQLALLEPTVASVRNEVMIGPPQVIIPPSGVPAPAPVAPTVTP